MTVNFKVLNKDGTTEQIAAEYDKEILKQILIDLVNEGRLVAEYSEDGNLIGVEILEK